MEVRGRTESPGNILARGPPPGPPQRLLDGFPTPESVAIQKVEHARGLDEQLNSQVALLMQRHKATLEFLRGKIEQRKKHTSAEIDQQTMQSEAELQAKYHEQMLMLSQASAQRKFELEKQANALAIEYRARQTREELLSQDYEVHRRYFEIALNMEVPRDVSRELGSPGGLSPGAAAAACTPSRDGFNSSPAR